MMLMMLPLPETCSGLCSNWLSNNGARALLPIRLSHCSRVMEPSGVGKNDEALFTSRSSLPHADSASAASR